MKTLSAIFLILSSFGAIASDYQPMGSVLTDKNNGTGIFFSCRDHECEVINAVEVSKDNEHAIMKTFVKEDLDTIKDRFEYVVVLDVDQNKNEKGWSAPTKLLVYTEDGYKAEERPVVKQLKWIVGMGANLLKWEPQQSYFKSKSKREGRKAVAAFEDALDESNRGDKYIVSSMALSRLKSTISTFE